MEWKIEYAGKKQDFKDAVLIAGLPGIGNVGKIVVDFLIDELKAVKVCEFFSYHMPHSVFVKEDNLIGLPKIELYYIKSKNLLVLTGDTQPIDESGTYSFCDALLDFFQDNNCKEIITLGGIGLGSVPKLPKVYATGNDKEIVKKYKAAKVSTKIYGVVGPIIGVSGLLLGLSGKRSIPAVSLLAETLGHPMYLGLKGSRELLKVLDKKLDLKVDFKNLEKEIDELESKMKLSEELGKVSKRKNNRDVSYIG
ncbi:PAC2 family protein [Candidatus Woesearchaeota archaeon]|nr:PAC2 family protein [Candidatus Woesearchaeota archaeon]